jgi:putative DNA primase/helicase
LDRRGFSGASEVHKGIHAVLAFLERNGQARFDEWGNREAHVINRAGTRKQAEGIDGWDFYITSDGWREACQGFTARDVARACAEAGILEAGKDGKSAQSVAIPGHGKTRCYVIRSRARAHYQEGEAA